MKGVRFYLEYENRTEKNKATVKQPGNHKGTVVAVYYLEQKAHKHKDGSEYWMYDCVCAVFDVPNSSCASSIVQNAYLVENCKRIPERLAREIHPNIIRYLERQS